MIVFSCRGESETVDYSTQYPWMFGVLSILVAAGTHPLPDYPYKFRTDGQKIRYRSHHIQALPNPDKVGGACACVRTCVKPRQGYGSDPPPLRLSRSPSFPCPFQI